MHNNTHRTFAAAEAQVPVPRKVAALAVGGAARASDEVVILARGRIVSDRVTLFIHVNVAAVAAAMVSMLAGRAADAIACETVGMGGHASDRHKEATAVERIGSSQKLGDKATTRTDSDRISHRVAVVPVLVWVRLGARGGQEAGKRMGGQDAQAGRAPVQAARR